MDIYQFGPKGEEPGGGADQKRVRGYAQEKLDPNRLIVSFPVANFTVPQNHVAVNKGRKEAVVKG